MLYLIGALLLAAIVLGPQWWVGAIMRRHAAPRADFPGTGGELARHLLDRFELSDVKVEQGAPGMDHYDPTVRTVRLSPANFAGRSVTAVAVAAHEVGHALQHAQALPSFVRRHRLVVSAFWIERIAAVLLLAAPLLMAALRAPALLALEIGCGLALMSVPVAVHLATLPVEIDASFNRALPVLRQGGYLGDDDLGAAHQVLRAASWTYVAGALVSLVNLARWVRVLRG